MGSTRLVWVLRVMAAAVLLGAAPAAGQGEPTVEEVRAWFLKAMDEAAEVAPLGEVRIVLEIEHPSAATNEQLAEWRREAAGKPQHPLWQQIEAEERRRSIGPDRTREVIWFLSNGRWRFNTDTYVAGGSEYHFDTASSGSTVWQLQRDHLALYGADGEAPNNVIENNFRQLQQHLGWLLTGGLHTAGVAERDSLVVEVRDLAWEAQLTSAKGTKWRFQGTWAEGEGRVESMQRRFADPDLAALSAVIEGWRPEHATLDAHVAEEVRIEVDGGGARVIDVIRLVEVAREPRSELLQKLEPPDPMGADVVRGELEVTRVSDYRPGRAESTLYDANTGARIESYSLEGLIDRKPERRSWLRMLGWGAALALVGTLAVIRFKKSPQRR